MRITLVHSAAFGDTILLIPLLRAIKLRFPSSVLTVVMRPAFGQMLMFRGLADAWHSAEDAEHSRWFGAADAAEGLPPAPSWANCDLLISAVAGPGDIWADHARRAMGLRASQAGDPAALQNSVVFFNPRPPADYPDHVTRFHRDQLAGQGLELPEPPLPPAVQNPDGRVLIHPGSGGESKCWPREFYKQLAADLVRNGIRPTFILGEAEAERWGPQAIQELREAYDTLFHIGFFELSEKMSRARVYIGNDSGVTHLAASVGLPTFAIFGPSNDVQWRPVGGGVKLLFSPDRSNLASLEVRVVLAAMLSELTR